MLTEYNVLQQQNIFDLIMKFYNDLDQTYAFILANPDLENIDFDFANVSNVVVKYDASYIKNTPSEIPTVQTNAPSNIASIRGYEVQNIYDLCGMAYGSFDRMYKFIQENGFDSINSTNVSGKSLVYDTNLVVDNMLYNHINNNSIVFATGSGTTGRSHDSSFNRISFN